MKPNRIQPRTLSGFRDFLPETMIPREWLMETAKRVYRSFGFAPIDTPALEFYEILGGKGSEETDRQMYRFKDNGGRDVGMRFDLTVPLARYVAQHIEKIGTPFKRYHIAPVWRGEKQQAGRYREFVQCDFDTIGTKSIASDIETGIVIHDLLAAIGFDAFTIRVNNRKVLNGVLEKFELSEKSVEVLRAIDKLEKAGREKVTAELNATGLHEQQVTEILQLAEFGTDNVETLDGLRKLASGNTLAEQGCDELEQLYKASIASGIDPCRLVIDPSIARGLDYYTGTVFETILDDLPSIGSVCSGGRYDNLAELFTSRELPGIGASLGLDRLLTAMEELGRLPKVKSTADVLIVYFDKQHLGDYLKLSRCLRSHGLNVEMFPDAKKLGVQLKYADKRGFQVAVIAGDNEWKDGKVQLKWLADAVQETVEIDENFNALASRILDKTGDTAS